MSDVTVTVRMPREMRDQLEAIGAATQRSKSFLAKTAIGQFVETEAEIIDGIKEALEDVRAGRVVPHEEAMRAIRKTIATAGKRAKTA